MECVIYGEPAYENLNKWEKQALISPLVEVVKAFFSDPENRRKCDEWKAGQKQSRAVVALPPSRAEPPATPSEAVNGAEAQSLPLTA